MFFSEHFEADVTVLEAYGALDINVISDLPVFIDTFLLFHSEKPEYQALSGRTEMYEDAFDIA